MPLSNATGKPNTNDYLLGRGAVFVAELDVNDKPLAWRHFGNVTSFTLTASAETLEHISSLEGLATKDKEVVTSQGLDFAFTGDEWNAENIADFVSGEVVAHTNPSVAGFTIWTLVAAGKITLGRWYDITTSAGERAYNTLAANVAIATTNASPVTLVKDTDYELDEEMGRFFLKPGSAALATAIGNVEGLTVTLTANGSAKAVTETRALTQSAKKVAIKFIGKNPANNDKQYELQIHKTQLAADGDASLISEQEWATMSFTGSAERNTAVDTDSPFASFREVAA